MKKKTIAIAAVALVVLCVLAGVLYTQFKPATTAGAKEVSVVVVHGDQSEKTFTYQTDAEYLGEVLQENKLIDGTVGQYGLFITTVDGETSDDSKQQWWCITKGGADVNTAADLTPIADGDQFGDHERRLLIGPAKYPPACPDGDSHRRHVHGTGADGGASQH